MHDVPLEDGKQCLPAQPQEELDYVIGIHKVSKLSALLCFIINQPFFLIKLFFCRNLFTRKQSARFEKQNDVGWKLFGKVPLRENSQKDPKKIQKEYEEKTGRAHRPLSPKQNVRKNLDFEPLSTTALILEDRPANLPAKPAEEAQKHRQQYEEMVVQAKKRGDGISYLQRRKVNLRGISKPDMHLCQSVAL